MRKLSYAVVLVSLVSQQSPEEILCSQKPPGLKVWGSMLEASGYGLWL